MSCTNKKLGFKEGKGTEGDPFELETFDDLHKIVNQKNFYYYRIVNDLYNENEEVISISLGDFYGHLNGKGHTIYDVKIDNPNIFEENESRVMNAGLFGIVKSDSKIHNLHFSHFDMDIVYYRYGNIGTLAGMMEDNSYVYDIDITGTMDVSLYDGNIGGIVGQGTRMESVYSDLTMEISSIGQGLTVGGIVGYNNGFISYCRPMGDMTVMGGVDPSIGKNYHFVGGVAGKIEGTMLYSKNLTHIDVIVEDETDMNVSVGGLTGSTEGIIRHSLSLGSISISSNKNVYAGGISGIINTNSYISNSLVVTPINYDGINTGNTYLGAVAGYMIDHLSIVNLYYSNEIEVNRAVGNYDDIDLINIEGHPESYYKTGEKPEYLTNFFYFPRGDFPSNLNRFFG